MNEKKAGIVTLYASQNFGAFLQSFAMQTVLECMGYNVSFLKYASLDLGELFFMIKTKNVRLAFFRVKQYIKYIHSRKYLRVKKNIYKGQHIDIVVIGSDTLWDVQNPTITPSDYYLGKNIKADTIIAYAPSANSTSAKEFVNVYGKQDNPFRELKSIGVRDGNTQKMVSEITGVKPQIVVDPTLLLDSQDYPIDYPNRKEKYILVYGYSFTGHEQKAIRKFAHSIGVKTISIGMLNAWCDENIVATVPEFLGYIKNAEYICTSTFHGSIFSVIMEKQFITFARKNYKVLDLLERLGLADRNGSMASEELDKFAIQEINYIKVREKISQLREESMEFLTKAIKG